MVKLAEQQLAKARTKDCMAAFSKLTHVVKGEVRIVDQSPLIVPIEQIAPGQERDEMFEVLRELLRGYRHTLEFDPRVLLEQFRLVDFARKVVGVGSVGTRAWIALLPGRDEDPLFLQMKEAEASLLEQVLGPSEFANHGERVVTGQRLVQAASDIFLGWLHVNSGWMTGRETSMAASSRTARARRRSSRWSREAWARTARCAAGRSLARTPAAATASRSPPTSATATRSTARSSSSPRSTRGRTSATTKTLAHAVKSGRIAAQTGL